jgi:hypothetical protein
MKNLIRSIVFILTLMGNEFAFAGTQVIGFEIGVSTLSQVKTTLNQQTNIKNETTNKWTNGTQFKTDGNSYDIRGLKEVLYIFDEQKKLAAIIMTMEENRFDSVFKAVSPKYKLISKQIPYVGNKYVKLKSQDSIVEIDAPHLSFDIEVRYIRDDLMKKFNEQSTIEEQAKKKKEASKF